MNAEVVDLAVVVPAKVDGVEMVAIRTADSEAHGAATQAARLALNTRESLAVVDRKVVTNVLTEWQQDGVARLIERQHGGEGGAVAYGFRMLHLCSVPRTSVGPCPKQTTAPCPLP